MVRDFKISLRLNSQQAYFSHILNDYNFLNDFDHKHKVLYKPQQVNWLLRQLQGRSLRKLSGGTTYEQSYGNVTFL